MAERSQEIPQSTGSQILTVLNTVWKCGNFSAPRFYVKLIKVQGVTEIAILTFFKDLKLEFNDFEQL